MPAQLNDVFQPGILDPHRPAVRLEFFPRSFPALLSTSSVHTSQAALTRTDTSTALPVKHNATLDVRVEHGFADPAPKKQEFTELNDFDS
jgi:hypothetical protein